MLHNALQSLRSRVSKLVRIVWRALPLSATAKNLVVGTVFRNTPILVSWSTTYKHWRTEEDHLERCRQALENRVPYTVQDRDYEEVSGLGRPSKVLARAIAFYLPQFHPIEENNRWWGEGFTEWTNVRRSRPQFEGHNQPRIPGELGYYNLVEDPTIRRRQADLADQYGLAGFCFYFYWFGGKRLLEAPVKAYAGDDEISFPFCLCWANENWSRRWDGRDDDVLIAQAHSADDDVAIIEHLSAYLRNPKYIRIGGRPLVIVYRPALLPDGRATAQRWRDWCKQAGLGEIHLAYTQSFDTVNPAEYGFDSAIEFPPNNMGLEPHAPYLAPTSDAFDCKIYDWTSLADRANAYDAPDYSLFRGVTPQWDNTPRRLEAGTVLMGSSPAAYGQWLRQAALDMTERKSSPDERIVFINAWNEWAEGCYLEPDVTHGYAWLAATRAALSAEEGPARIEPSDLVPLELPEPRSHSRKIIVMVHDLHRNGAQYLSLNFAASLKRDFGYEVVIITPGQGDLETSFQCYGTVIKLDERKQRRAEIVDRLQTLKSEGFSCAIINSSASGWIAPYMHETGIVTVGLVHEMPVMVRKMALEDGMRAMDRYCRSVVFATDMVRDLTASEILGHDWAHSTILPQGLYKREGVLELADKGSARRSLCAELDVAETSRFVIGVGFGDHRKGIDLFCDWAIAAARRNADLHFVWIGDIEPDWQQTCDQKLSNASDVAKNVHLIGFRKDTASYYKAACAYALTSREDPYPSTVLEALSAGAPSFVVSQATGIEDLASTGAVKILKDTDAEGFADALEDFLADEPAATDSAETGLAVIRETFGFKSFVGDILRLLGRPVPKISVVVPNYNYERFLPHRLATILNQSLPVWEIIFLDDASTDDSLDVARKYLHNCPIRYRIICNSENSGSVFSQWKKGVDLAQGDIVWIAEADDWAGRDFVDVASRAFEDESVIVSYTQSNQVSEDGKILCADYLDYVGDIDADRWRRPFVTDGSTELAEGLSVKNTLPNVSGVLFRRDALKQVLSSHFEEIISYRVAGDWCVYAHLAGHGGFAFDPRPLNYHRRHGQSVTVSGFSQDDWNEIKRMQLRIAEMTSVPQTYKNKAKAYLALLAERLKTNSVR